MKQLLLVALICLQVFFIWAAITQKQRADSLQREVDNNKASGAMIEELKRQRDSLQIMNQLSK
jgi:hypothetical protein